MRALLLCCLALLAGCERETITLNARHWICVETATVRYTHLHPVGKTAAAPPAKRTQCVQWKRLDRDDD